jgi:hypothetical protein
VLGFEAIVEAPRDPLNIEGCPGPLRNVNDRQVGLLVERKNQTVELLDQRLAGLAALVDVLAGRRPGRLPPDPLPDLCCPLVVDVDDEVLMHRPRCLALNLATEPVVWKRAVLHLQRECHHAALLGDTA